ncbi:MAG: rhomboid family intramembrane serine protease [Bacteroidales bacterium]|nr:rhomboid family intramembrane serine protease [Bacteroidales bacterium]
MMQVDVTILLIIVTAVVSMLCFNSGDLFSRLQFNAYQVFHRKEVHRLLTHGFVHVNWWHLIVNMFVLYFFGRDVENTLMIMQSQGIVSSPKLLYLGFYLTAIIVASTISLFRHKDHPFYNSVGASGAVAAVMFFSIFFSPWRMLYLYGILAIPGILFAVAYIVYSQYMAKKGGDNINHDAHLLGAVFGFIMPLFIDLDMYRVFISQLLSPF